MNFQRKHLQQHCPRQQNLHQVTFMIQSFCTIFNLWYNGFCKIISNSFLPLEACYADLDPHLKPLKKQKPCLFPFTLENQVYENKCVRSSLVNKNETDFRGFCPTSEPHGKWLENGNYGYCREKGCEVVQGT